jgi:16S rRNA (uracil1498-N3)-methyltransferase
MTRRRFIADEVEGDRAALLGDHAAHLAKVLRAQVGQQFDIAANGSVRRGEIINVSPKRVDFLLHELIESGASDEKQITLLLSIFKFDRMEWALEKAVELGASTIVPVIARRTESHLASSAAKRVERWRRIARESAEQSRRSAGPEISSPIKLQDAIANQSGTRIILSEHEAPARISFRQAVDQNPSDQLTLAIGSEGGWTEEELALFQQHEWIFASLGPTVLRVETAVIAALAIAIS